MPCFPFMSTVNCDIEVELAHKSMSKMFYLNFGVDLYLFWSTSKHTVGYWLAKYPLSKMLYHKYNWLVFWLIVWVLWRYNLCRLFNGKSIFMKIVLFQTIQFGMSTQLNCQKHFYFNYSVYSNSSNSVLYKYRFCLHTVKCQNSSILNNSV